jgi:DNA-binding FadR family transcriptional regulator
MRDDRGEVDDVAGLAPAPNVGNVGLLNFRCGALGLATTGTKGTTLKTVARKSVSAVAKAAGKLRRLSMEKGDGEFIGSEEDLITLLGVSRPTLRQASAQVIQENLISVRRGVGGGYFACIPSSMTVSRMASIYLQSRKLHLPDILQALKPLRTEIAGLAAHNIADGDREPLVAFIESENSDLENRGEQTYRDFLVNERKFGRIIANLARNDVLNLFLNIVYDLTPFTRRDEDVWVNHPERVEAYRCQRMNMAKAILDGDEEIARVASSRCSKLIVEWVRLDSKVAPAGSTGPRVTGLSAHNLTGTGQAE